MPGQWDVVSVTPAAQDDPWAVRHASFGAPAMRPPPAPPPRRRSFGEEVGHALGTVNRLVDQTGQGAQDAIVSTATRVSSPQGVLAGMLSDTAGLGQMGANAFGDAGARAGMTRLRTQADRLADRLNPSRHLVDVLPRSAPPTSGMERGAYTLGSNLPFGLMPGGLAARLGSVALPTVGTEAGGAAARYGADQWNAGQPDPTHRVDAGQIEDAGRAAGGAAGGLGTALLRPPSPVRLSGEALQNHTPADIALARALMEDSQALPGGGIRVYGDEALARTAPSRAGDVRGLMQSVSSTARGGPMLADQVAGRPAEVRAATMGTADQIAPRVADPAALGVAAQGAADTALTGIRQDINAQARPHYDALPAQLVPGQQFAQMLEIPSFRMALDEVRGNPLLNARLEGLPNNSMAVVNEVMKRISRNETASTVSETNPGGDNTIAGVHREGQASVNTLVDQLTEAGQLPGDYQAARGIVATGRQQDLAPAQAGPLGRISRTDQAPQQATALYPTAPPEGQPNITVQALRGMEPHAPGVGADLTRLRLVDALNEQGQDLQTGQNPNAGARTVTHLAANPEQAATYRAGVEQVAPDALPTVDSLFEALRATGTRLNQGSTTAANQQGVASLDAAGPMLTAGTAAVSTPRINLDRIQGWLQRNRVNANAEGIINLFANNPAAFEREAMAARQATGPGTEGYTTLIKALMAARNANQAENRQ